MTATPDVDNADDEKTAETVENFLRHVEGAMQSVQSLKWDEVEFHLGSLEKIAASATASQKPFLDPLLEPISGFAHGLEQLANAKTPEDTAKALDHFTTARNALRALREEQREMTKHPGFAQFALGIESQMLSVQQRMAREQGNASEVARLDQQMSNVMEEIIATLESDDPMRHIIEANKQYREALQKFRTGTRALGEMNLDLAQQYLEEASQALSRMQEHFSKARNEGVLLKAAQNLMEGFGLLVSGQDVYVRTLRAAIIGEINRSDIIDLEKAERGFLDGAVLISKGTAAMPGLLGGLDITPIAQQAGQLVRNFRTLCERSLSPKTITLTTAPKVVFYFLGTFIVLLVGLPMSGLIAQLESNDLAFLLLVSLLVSVIGAFGFEAARLIPLFDAFTRVLPWARESGK